MNLFDLSPEQKNIVRLPVPSSVFLKGQAGSGKSTAAVERMMFLIDQGIPADTILVLVPQRSLGRNFQDLSRSSSFRAGGPPGIFTFVGLSQRMISLFWPIVAKNCGISHPTKPPVFLTLETAQYHLASIMDPLIQMGYFENIAIEPHRLYSQVLDNLNKSAVVGFSPDEIAQRLKTAWIGKSTQTTIYDQAQECALLFRQFCLDRNLLDFSLQISVFSNHLWKSFLCREFLLKTYRHLIYDNAEEDYPVAHDIIKKWLPGFQTALIITDTDAGFRSFMGADPTSAQSFERECEKVMEINDSFVMTPGLKKLQSTLSKSLLEHGLRDPIPVGVMDSFSTHTFQFYPPLLDWVRDTVLEIVRTGSALQKEIAILTPFLSDSLLFSLTTRLIEVDLQVKTFRPSRGLREEPAIKAMITFSKLSYPSWSQKPSREEVRNALMLVIEDCDFVRADLLTQILFSSTTTPAFLRPFDPINRDMQQRLTFTIGERYEKLRSWLELNSNREIFELDLFLGRLFGEVLSQPGFRFHDNYDSASAVNRMIESSRNFRKSINLAPKDANIQIGKEYIHMVEEGVLSAQYLSDQDARSRENSIIISPAYSYLMSHQAVKYQFWLDIGSQGWWARLDQPLTQPHVLNRNWAPNKLWTDAEEYSSNQETMSRITSGLTRQCSDHVFMCSLGINEQGNEERGALILAVQNILKRKQLDIKNV
ncbi:MAG: hypothetical protein NTZ74_07205 [Chloroflexi bacterium]|nr:hypothetical protein [Chloroflexota bacterium]